MKFKYILYTLLLFLVSCAPKNSPLSDSVEAQGAKFKEQSKSRTVDVLDEPYLGATAKSLGSQSHPTLNKTVTLRIKGPLPVIAAAISDLISMPVQVATDTGIGDHEKKESSKNDPHEKPRGSRSEAGINLDLEAMLQAPSSMPSGISGLGVSGQVLKVSYEGTVRGLLDHVALLSGYGWDYDVKNGVVFARMMVKTFCLLGAPGAVTYDNQLTNKSKENARSGIGSTGQTVAVADTSSQNAQSNSVSWKFDIWADTENAVKSLLSSKGSVVSNPAAGTLTVRDAPDILRRVATYIDDVNSRLSRQVALTIQVWSLNVSDNLDVGVSLQAMFQDENIEVSGSVTSGDLNTVTASIVSGTLKNSSAILRALEQWGHATQVTSAGGICMSNQPLPAMAIERTAYLAGMGISVTDSGQTTEVTPGEVTTGFSMTVIPHILDQRRVILHYNVNISDLEEMKEFETSDITVQLPQVSTRAFSQRTTMKMGQTLVLTGFEKELRDLQNSIGITNTFKKSQSDRTLLIITIQVESAEV